MGWGGGGVGGMDSQKPVKVLYDISKTVLPPVARFDCDQLVLKAYCTVHLMKMMKSKGSEPELV